MKKNKTIKLSAAAALTLSAVTPVAALAAESDVTTAATGFYTKDSYLSGPDFRQLSNAEKRTFFSKP